ncbi:Bone marrow proteoglycan [Schistosoma japonicum]|nr:Bone marrow proteoglycan [Schistosoma japonicum]
MLLRIFEIVLIFNTAYAIEKSRGALGSRVFTFVHGDENAKLNFSEAEHYCKFVGQQSDNNDMLDSLNKHDRQHKKWFLQTALASIHSYPENLALVNWISKQEKHSFWIGGKITKTVNEFMRPLYVLHWVDGSKSDFSLLRLPNPEMTSISVGEQRCVSVDYSSGQWGVHLCSEKRYFVCLTVPVLSTDNQMISKQKEQSSLTVPNKSESKDTLIDDELGSML